MTCRSGKWLPEIAREMLAFISGESVCNHPEKLCQGPLPLRRHARRTSASSCCSGHGAVAQASAKANALLQIRQFTAERIVENKDQLFDSFRAADPECTGTLPRDTWSRVLLETLGKDCAQTLTLELMEQLAESWGLLPDALVKYVGFLHRFQIRGGDEKECGSQPVDFLKEVSRIREAMLDAAEEDVAKMLDPNSDATVSKAELTALLPRFGVEVPTFQAAALYETIVAQAGEHPLTVDSAILCLALVSQAPVPAGEWSEFAEELGEQLRSTGQSLPKIFRSWDEDGSGFLSVAELEAVLVKLPCDQAITHEQAATFAEYFDSVGLADGKVSIFEFVRALAPRKLALDLKGAMNKELLKLVWICRPALRTVMLCHDPLSTGKVDAECFCEGLGQINGQLERLGHPVLSETQIKAVCEIASGGGSEVWYRCFLESLHVLDIESDEGAGEHERSAKPAKLQGQDCRSASTAALGGA